MDFAKFIEWSFYGIIGFSALFGVSILANIKTSINELNSRIAVIIEKTAWHEKWLEKHDEEIKRINELK